MHLGVLVLAVALAVALRGQWHPTDGSWSQRWGRAMLAFCCPLMVLGSAALAVLWMGHHGTMLGWAVGPLGCRLSQMGLGGGLLIGLQGILQAGWATWRWRRYPWVDLPQGVPARCLDTATPLAAQVGFWRPTLIVSQGWLERLSPQEQAVILAHEQAHAHYHDPLCFWLLGWVKRLTGWLPNTQALWQELLLLREIRADRWAVQQAHPLAVAELLVKISRQGILEPTTVPTPLVGFSGPDELERLEQRVDALLAPAPEGEDSPLGWAMVGMIPALMPLLAIGLHHPF